MIEVNALSDMPAEVLAALTAAMTWAADHNNNAFLYLRALPEAIITNGTRGCRIQLKYINENLRSWKGEDARWNKLIIRAYIKELEQ